MSNYKFYNMDDTSNLTVWTDHTALGSITGRCPCSNNTSIDDWLQNSIVKHLVVQDALVYNSYSSPSVDSITKQSITDYHYFVSLQHTDDNTKKKMYVTSMKINGTPISVVCPEEEANQYIGFCLAVAKYYCMVSKGPSMSTLADYFINKLPKQQAQEEKARTDALELAQRRQAKRAERLRKYKIRCKAKALAEQQEIEELAKEFRNKSNK